MRYEQEPATVSNNDDGSVEVSSTSETVEIAEKDETIGELTSAIVVLSIVLLLSLATIAGIVLCLVKKRKQ